MTRSGIDAPLFGEQPDALKPATLEACHEVIAAQAARLFQLEAKLADLQEQVRLNSRNSSKPPSSDGPGAGGSGNRAQRRASQHTRGTQKGHPGSFRPPVDEVRIQAPCPIVR